MIVSWQQEVRRRLEAGEVITGGQIRREFGHVGIYTFLQRLEKYEGWVFDKKPVQTPEYLQGPVTEYRLRKKRRVRPPTGTGPRTNMEVRPTDVAIQRLLAGEELEGKAIALELGVTNSLLSYCKRKLEALGYEFEDERIGFRVFTRVIAGPGILEDD